MAVQVEAKKTPLSSQTVREAFASFVALESSPASCNAVPILMSQSAFETGNWAELICYNFGNFKRLHGQDWCEFETTEIVKGQRVKMLAAFVAYPDAESGARGFLSDLKSMFPGAWAAAMRGDVVAFVHELKVRGYFTADEKEYLAGVSRELDGFGFPNLETARDLITAIAALGIPEPDSFVGDGTGVFAGFVKQYQRTHPELADDGDPGPLTRNAIRLDTEAKGQG